MSVHVVTTVRPLRFVLTVGNFGDKAAESDCIGSLDFTPVSGREAWSVHAVFPGPDGERFGCIVSVNPAGFADRSGRIKQLVQAWLCRLERLGGLCGTVTEFDGGSDCVDFPTLHISND
jgi:hypothetical protein